MDYTPDEYTRSYIVQALFQLMEESEYEKISVTDIAEKAGVSRGTFYRYFKRKEDVVEYYLEHSVKKFLAGPRYFPRCKEDHIRTVKTVFTMFRENREQFRCIRKAHLEYLYLDSLHRKFASGFSQEYPGSHSLTPYLYAGMLFNISMAWLDSDCRETPDELAQVFVDAIYPAHKDRGRMFPPAESKT